uniref:Transposable element n=1 Tax=Ixodes ricinus TaxID=34613 RepID=A0A131XNH1_IXORI
MVSEEDRCTIVTHHKWGMPILDIARLLNFDRTQVRRVVQRFQETEGIKDRQESGRPRTARTPALKNTGKKKIQRNAQRGIRKLAQEHGVGYGTMRESIREDLQLVPYKLAKEQLPTS